MPWGLKRYQQTRQLHFITFSCYHRAPLLGTPQARDAFVTALKRVREWYGFYVVGYVVMDKRDQVFISSTYADLKEERRAVIEMVIASNCIPAGMELFPAADEAQLAFIKRVINDCDYYLLIIGGRYGSVDESGVSYTEQEYDYAVDRNLTVIALLHENPDEIPLGKSEKEPAGRERLQKFRGKVSKERLVKFWKSAEQLPALVAVSLLHAMNAYPAVGLGPRRQGS